MLQPEKHEIVLRPATWRDLALLRYWDTKQHVIDSDPDEDWNWETELSRNPPWREQWVAERNGEPIGFLQIIDPHEEETHYWGEVAPHQRAIDIWIGEETNLNQGYGTQMMQQAIERCFADPQVTRILIDPLKTNTKAHRFYERLGFTFVEERAFNGTACYVYALTRVRV
ncbi:MAG: acetyltransferase [Leptolyngbya sp. SIO3F4]|nr:acetyltransferase [Leptolyngbya sp. SIO3F4]